MESNTASQIELIEKIDQAAYMDIEGSLKQITMLLENRQQFAQLYKGKEWNEVGSESLLAGIGFCNEQISKLLGL